MARVCQLTKVIYLLIIVVVAALFGACGSEAKRVPAHAIPIAAAWSVTGERLADLPLTTGVTSLDRDLEQVVQMLDSVPGLGAFAAYALNAGKEGLTLGVALHWPAGPAAATGWTVAEAYDFRGDIIRRYARPGQPACYTAQVGELVLLGFLPLAVEEMLGQVQQSAHMPALPPGIDTAFTHYLQPAELPALLAAVRSPAGEGALRRLAGWFRWLRFRAEPVDSVVVIDGHVGTDLPVRGGGLPANWPSLLPAGTTAFDWGPLVGEQLQPAAPAARRWWASHLQPWVGHQSLRLRTATNERVWVLPQPDLAEAAKRLAEMAASTGLPQRTDYLLYELRQLALPGLLGGVWADSKGGALPWVTIADSMVIFAESRAGLEQWLDSHMLGATLAQDAAFGALVERLPTEPAALLVYRNLKVAPAATDYFPAWIPPDWVAGYPRQLHAFYPARDNWRWRGIGAGTAGVPARAGAFEVAWRREINGGLRQLLGVYDLHGKTTTEVVTQDSTHALQLLDDQGAVRWRLPLDGPLLGRVYQLPAVSSGTVYLAQTRRAIYLLDEQGRALPNYPRRLSHPASAPLTVADLDHDGSFYYFIPTMANEIVGFDGRGEPLRFWNPRPETGPVKQAILHFQNSQADYIAALDTLGRLRAYARTGELRWSVDGLELYAGSRLYGQALPNGDARLVVTEAGGKLRIVNLNGQSFPLPMRAGGQAYDHFLFADVWGDDRNDYLALAGRQLALHAYDTKGYAHRWTVELPLAADALFSLPAATAKVGLLNRDRGLIYLLSADGKLTTDEALAGQHLPIYTANGLLVTAYNGVVYGYRVGE